MRKKMCGCLYYIHHLADVVLYATMKTRNSLFMQKKIKVFNTLENKKDVVRKHNYLTEAKYRISLQEARVFAWLVSEIYKDDEETTVFRIPVSELAKLAGLKNKNNYQQMKVVTEKLVQRFIQVEDLSKGKHLQATLVASAEYEDNFGTVEIEISKKLKPYLLSLKGGQITYTNLACTLALKSSYSIRIYDLLAQYRVAGKRTIEVAVLKEMLGIEKVKSYNRFNNFDQRVLEPAYKEINEKTDILFEYKKIKRGRTITAIKFIIKTKKGNTARISSPKSNSSEIERLNFYGVSKAKARGLIELDISKVREALESIKTQSSEIKNPAGWLVQYIEQGWSDSGKELTKNKRVKRQIHLKEEQKKQISEQKESDKFKAYNRYVGDEILKVIELWDSKKEAENWENLKEQKWRLIKSSVFPKQGIDRWTTFLNRDIVIEYLKTHYGLELITQAEFVEKE